MRYSPARRVASLCAVAAAAALCVLTSGNIRAPQAAAATAQLAFSPASSSIAVGGSVAVDITISNVSNLGGYDVSLQFNPSVVHLTSLQDSGFVKSGGNIVACNPATIDNSAGTAQDSCATVSPFGTPTPGVSTVSPTALMHASFTGVGAGTSSLTLTGTTLQDPNGGPIPVTLGSGSIAVSGPAPATPTPTPTLVPAVGGITQLVDPAGFPASRQARANWPLYLIAPFAALVGFVACAAVCWRRARAG